MKIIKSTLFLLAVLATLTSVASATDTALSIENTTINPGETAVVQIKLKDISNVGGVDIWLKYNKDVVIVDRIEGGDLGSLTKGIDNNAGVAKMNWFSTTGRTGDLIYATVTLKAVGNPGAKSDLELEVQELVDADTFEEIPHSVDNGKSTIFGLDTMTLDYVSYPQTCFDGVKNGDEINTDCGESCPICTNSSLYMNISLMKNNYFFGESVNITGF